MFKHLNSTWLNYMQPVMVAQQHKGHKSNGALQPRVREQLGGAGEECEGHSTLLIAFNCVLFVLW